MAHEKPATMKADRKEEKKEQVEKREEEGRGKF